MLSNEELMENIRLLGCKKSFDTLYHRWLNEAISYLKSYVIGRFRFQLRAALDDMVQEAFMRVMTHRSPLARVENFRPWFYHMMNQTALNTIKSIKRELQRTTLKFHSTHKSQSQKPHPRVETDASAVMEVIDSLPTPDRDYIFKICVLGVTMRSLADEEGINYTTLHMRVQKIMRSLLARLSA